IKSKIADPAFFGPGYSSPFNPWNSSFTTYLISLFGTVVPFLELERGGVVIDSGCGYSWSTEWLFKSGYDAIGVDICRTYLEIAVQRLGTFRPHLVVGDVENLPLRSGIANAILAYESFHHIPDRQKAMTGYHRVMGRSGRVILAEPGAAHEKAEVAVDAMEKYGILEKGMDLSDVVQYADGTGFNPPEQVFVFSTSSSDRPARVDDEFAKRHSTLHSNVFRLTKGTRIAHALAHPPLSRRSPIGRVLRRVRATLRLGAR
ncbi:MAG: class I SAM-dependent methyltransferase, partial [Vicinamibacterales bacterium]